MQHRITFWASADVAAVETSQSTRHTRNRTRTKVDNVTDTVTDTHTHTDTDTDTDTEASQATSITCNFPAFAAINFTGAQQQQEQQRN